MQGLLSDVNIQGHVQALARILESPDWRDVWQYLKLTLRTFRDVGLPPYAPDSLVWRTCQEQQLVLLTANRNDDGPESLEAAIRGDSTPTSLPVFTVADPERVATSREYATRVVERMLVSLLDIDRVRGTGRLYLP